MAYTLNMAAPVALLPENGSLSRSHPWRRALEVETVRHRPQPAGSLRMPGVSASAEGDRLSSRSVEGTNPSILQDSSVQHLPRSSQVNRIATIATAEEAEDPYDGNSSHGGNTVVEGVLDVIEVLPGPRVLGDWPLLVVAPVALLGGTFIFAVYNTVKKFISPRQKRKRQINKNLTVLEELNKFLPSNREKLTSSVISKIRGQTGFTNAEIFRKYLRYLLNERPFDEAEVADVLQLQSACLLTDPELVEVLNESARKMYERTGVLMVNPRGMSAEGLKRKATGRAIFAKLVYLSELETLIPADSEVRKLLDIPGIFGATEDDTNAMRIVSLNEFDSDKMEELLKSTNAVPAGEASAADKEPTPKTQAEDEDAL